MNWFNLYAICGQIVITELNAGLEQYATFNMKIQPDCDSANYFVKITKIWNYPRFQMSSSKPITRYWLKPGGATRNEWMEWDHPMSMRTQSNVIFQVRMSCIALDLCGSTTHPNTHVIRFCVVLQIHHSWIMQNGVSCLILRPTLDFSFIELQMECWPAFLFRLRLANLLTTS